MLGFVEPVLFAGACCLSFHVLPFLFYTAHADDGAFRVWDLRAFKADAPIAHFAWHPKRITSIEWSFDDENVLAVGSADNTVTVWDMSLEEDEDAEIALLEKQARAAGLGDGEAGKKGAAAAAAALPLPSMRDDRLKDIPPQLLFIHAGECAAVLFS